MERVLKEVKKLSQHSDVLTVADLCEILHVGRKVIYKLMNNGNLRYVKLGYKHVTTKIWLKEFLNSQSSDSFDSLKNKAGCGIIIDTLSGVPARKEPKKKWPA